MAIGALSASRSEPPVQPDRQKVREQQPPAAAKSTELSPEELTLITKLKARDTAVRQHEQAHLAAAGGLAVSGASYTYQRGPNGVNYAVGGEVRIDTSPGRTPEDTIARARTIAAAALAPADPSGADRAVAAQAAQLEQQARGELAQQAALTLNEVSGAGNQDRRAEVAHAYGQTSTSKGLIDLLV
jgi:hypothetical protein